MELLVGLLSLAFAGLVIGALGRLAVPGPDPMPLWTTILLGLVGAFVGGGLGYAVAAEPGSIFGAIVFAALLVIVYRRIVQKRGITGPEAKLRPTRGFGIRRRAREEHLQQLVELRDAGVLTSEEYEAKRAQLLARGKG